MKKHFLGLIMSLAIMLNSYAQEAMIINGTTTDNSNQKVALYKVINGRIEQIAQTNTVNNKFAFKFHPTYNGFYVIGKDNNPFISNYHIIYGKENEVLNIALDGLNYDLFAKNSKENGDLSRYQFLLRELKEGSKINATYTFDKFFPNVERVDAERGKFKTQSKDVEFLDQFKVLKDYLFTYYALSYRYLPKTKHPKDEDLVAFYKNIDQQKFLTENLLALPFGDAFMTNLITDAYVTKKMTINKNESYVQKSIDFIPTEVIKAQFLVLQSQNTKSYDEYTRLVQPNEIYISLEDQKNRLNSKLTELADSKPGNDFIDFSFVDYHGKTFSKKDFSNKVIILDFWATWCAPCKQEEPFFEQLAEEYQGKAVEFVAISTDKDKKAWEKYVQPKLGHFKGIHLHAGNENILSKAYKVNTIPRYMVIDKNGKITSINSPRPSSPELKKIIDNLL